MRVKKFRTAFLTYVLPVVTVLVMVMGCGQANNGNMQLCKHQYALCTSALCVPQPGDPAKAICFCDVEEDAGMATVPCNTIAPSTDLNGIRTLYSMFSVKQFQQGKKGLKCPSGTPWTWCLNKRCTLDPSNPKQALCICDVKRTGEWTTLGGDCDTSTCTTGYWSGAPIQAAEEGNAFMIKALELKTSPLKWCPAASL